MEEKNELNDILLHADEKEGKEKKILFAALILLFVFFVVLGVMKFTSGESEESNETVKQEVNQTDVNADAGFEQMALDENSTDANISQVLQKLKEGSNESIPAPQAVEPPVEQAQPVQSAPVPAPAVSAPVKNPVKAPVEPAVVKTAPQVKKEEPKNTIKPTAQKPEPKEVVKTTPKPTAEIKTTPVKKEIKPVAKTEEKPKTPKTAPSTIKVEDVKKAKVTPKPTAPVASGPRSYVQVGNFTGKPKDELLGQIKANGYTYVVKEIVKDGVTTTKVLVGPFDSVKLNENIGKIRTNIKADAFVVRD